MIHRRQLLTALPAGLLLTGCDALTRNSTAKAVIGAGEHSGNIFSACVDLDCIDELEDDAQACRWVAFNVMPHCDAACIEAAYQLIETEPALRRRWFQSKTP